MSDNNSNTSIIPETNLSDSTNSIDISIFVFGAAFALSGMIILNTLLTNLNGIMKTILNILSAHTFLAYYTLAVILSSGGRDVFTCSFMTIVMKSLCFIIFDHFAIISCVRFYLVWKSAQNESLNKRLVIGISSFVYLLDYVINILLTTLTDTTYVMACLNDPSTHKDPYPYIIQGIILGLEIVLGLYYDNKYIGFIRTNGQPEVGLVIPVEASWVSLATGLILVVSSGIVAPKGREISLTTINVLGFLLPFQILVTYLALIYQETKKASQQEGQDGSGEDSQSYTHLREVSKENRRVKRNSVTENNIAQQLQIASDILTLNEVMEHTSAQKAQAFDINEVTSAKKTVKLHQTDNDVKKKSKTNKIPVKINEELSFFSTSRSQCQPNLLENQSIQANQENHDQEDIQQVTISSNNQANEAELIEQEMVHFNLSRKNEQRDTSDSINTQELDQMISEEMSYYNLTQEKPDEKTKYNSWDSESVDQNVPQQVVLNPRSLLEDQQIDARRVLSFCKSLDDDIFELLADLEGKYDNESMLVFENSYS